MSEQQPIQVVMQLTKAQERENARIAELEAAQAILEARVAAAVPILKAAWEADEALADNSRQHQGLYSHEVQFEGATWVFTHESYSQRVLSRVDGSMTLTVRHDTLPAGRMVGINVDMLSAYPENILNFIRVAAQSDDRDAKNMSRHVLELSKFTVEWAEGNTSVSIIDMYLLMIEAANVGTMMVDTKSGAVFIPTNIQYIPADPLRGRPEMVGFNRKVVASVNGKLVDALQSDRIAQQKMTGATVPVRPATEAEVAAAAERGLIIHNMLRGTGPNGVAHLKYEGLAYTPGMWGSRVPHAVDGRVVIDPEGCRLADPSTQQALLGLSGIYLHDGDDDDYDDDEQPTKVPEVTEHQRLAILSPAVIIFNLDRGAWMAGDASHLSEINFRKDAFNRLVLDAQRKRLVEALVVHTNDGDGVDVDIIDGKGGGSIFLLDGPPGTGKTLTAEATSEKLQSILYKVGQGELGTNASHLEKKLNSCLNLARRWNAVLLIDEADVFLEKRSTENLERNAMVAVFLRLLEYYNGILFLTTNRGDNFDPAVISRVTLALHFKRPTAEGRVTIWNSLLANAGITLTAKEAVSLAEIDINGREIKNAINSSRALAKADGVPVNYTHIREIVDASMLFATEVNEAKR